MKKKLIIVGIILGVLILSSLSYFYYMQKKPIKVVYSIVIWSKSSDSLVNAFKYAFEEINYTIDGRKVELVIKNDGDSNGAWVESLEMENANAAVLDKDVIAYVGPAASGAAAISIPITNEAGLAQIGFTTTYPGLTKEGYGEGEPEKYYPTGVRNFFRIIPTDDVQGKVAAKWAKELGFESVYIFDDGDLYGVGVANLFEEEALSQGLNVLGHETLDSELEDYYLELDAIKDLNPDLIYFGGRTPQGGYVLARGINEYLPGTDMMGADGLWLQSFIDAAGSGSEGVYVTTPLGELSVVSDEGRDFVDKYTSFYETGPITISGTSYEAAKVIIRAIDDSKLKTRGSILRELSKEKVYDSIFGDFSFDENGDTNLSLVSGYRVEDAKFVFQKVLI